MAEESQRPELLIMAYLKYPGYNNLYKHYTNPLHNPLKAEQISAPEDPGISLLIAKNLVSIYLAGYEFDQALEYSYKSLPIATMTENIAWNSESYLGIAKSLEGKNQKIEAFRNYYSTTSLAERIKHTGLQIKEILNLRTFMPF